MNWPHIKTLLAALLAVMSLVGCGDILRAPTEEEMAEINRTWTAAEDLVVTVVPAPPADEKIFLVDTTASHHFAGAIGDDVVALAQRDEKTAICILQIGSDSRSTAVAPLCLKPVVQEVCVHEDIKSTGYFNTKEEARYKAAETRIDQEVVTCNAQLEEARKGRRERQDEEIVRYLKSLPRAGMTDLLGAFARIQEVTTCGEGCNRVVWVFSDLKDDPLRKRESELKIHLNGADNTELKVRLIVQEGEGYNDDRQASWTAQFASWGVAEPDVEWKTYAPGEFAVDAGTTGVVSRGMVVPERKPAVPATPAKKAAPVPAKKPTPPPAAKPVKKGR